MPLRSRSTQSNQRNNPPDIWPILDPPRRRRSTTPRDNRNNNNNMSADDKGEAVGRNADQTQVNDNNGAGGQGAEDVGAADGGQKGAPVAPAAEAALGRMVPCLPRLLLQMVNPLPKIMQQSRVTMANAGTITTQGQRRTGEPSARVLLELLHSLPCLAPCGARPLTRLFLLRRQRGFQLTSSWT